MNQCELDEMQELAKPLMEFIASRPYTRIEVTKDTVRAMRDVGSAEITNEKWKKERRMTLMKLWEMTLIEDCTTITVRSIFGEKIAKGKWADRSIQKYLEYDMSAFWWRDGAIYAEMR